MKAVILQSNYLPWKGYFDLIHDADVCIFYDEVKYTKNDWRNRNQIYGKNGLQWLTIPINKNAVKLKISEVKLNHTSWQQLHYKSIYFEYKNARHFYQLELMLQEFFVDREWALLSDLNQKLVERTCKMLCIKTQLANSRDFILEEDRIGRLISLLKQVGRANSCLFSKCRF